VFGVDLEKLEEEAPVPAPASGPSSSQQEVKSTEVKENNSAFFHIYTEFIALYM
jgi:hypothetical protein